MLEKLMEVHNNLRKPVVGKDGYIRPSKYSLLFLPYFKLKMYYILYVKKYRSI